MFLFHFIIFEVCRSVKCLIDTPSSLVAFSVIDAAYYHISV